VFVLDALTSECLHHEPVIGYPPTRSVHILREILAEHPELEIRNDLIDCGIDVCSVEVRVPTPSCRAANETRH
jgi:translation initiation factor eIF-2B subunit epsilon